jgi:hypothetical protein
MSIKCRIICTLPRVQAAPVKPLEKKEEKVVKAVEHKKGKKHVNSKPRD